MKSPDKSNIMQFQCMHEPLSLKEVIKESNRCLLCFDAPCSQACPAGTDPGKFIRQLKLLNYKGAARTIRNNNILGTVCSFICPVEKLCEKACSINVLEDPVNIRGLQRFAVEYGKTFGIEPLTKSLNNKGNVAVIGCGPAGMACAATLAKMDYKVTIFEREGEAGGVARWNIQEFRLPESALDHDKANLADLGVEIRYHAEIGSEDAIVNMLGEGYDAVFIGCGLALPARLDMFEGFSNAVDYSSFLRQIKFDRAGIDLKNKHVAIIGGGSVAIDAAVAAKACGAGKVYLISLEDLPDLPADKEEIALAGMMHVMFKTGSRITHVLSDGSRITGLKGSEISWIEPGVTSPGNARLVPGTEFHLLADLVVQAIGTLPGREVAHLANGLRTIGNGVIEVDSGFETSIPGVFAGGDVVNGGATIVQAVGEGKKAALGIDNYLSRRSGK